MTGAPQGANRRGEGRRPDRGRVSSRRKTEAVLRLLRGEYLDALSRELGVTAATLAQCRDRFLAAGEVPLKSRPSDDRDAVLIDRAWAVSDPSVLRIGAFTGLLEPITAA